MPAERIGEAVAAEFGVKPSDLHAHGHRAGIAKSLAVELCCMLSGKSQRDVARYYGYRTDGGVARQRRLLRQKMRNSPPLESLEDHGSSVKYKIDSAEKPLRF